MLCHRSRSRSAFTLIELLIVMGIIAVLVGLLVPAVQKVREAAFKTQCTNNLGQLGKAFLSYQTQVGSLPPSVVHFDTSVQNDGWATWAVLILPHIDQENIYRAWDITKRYSSQTDAARAVSIPAWFCPSRRNPVSVSDFAASTNYDGGRRGALSDYVVCDGNTYSLHQTDGDGGGVIVAAESAITASGRDEVVVKPKSRTKMSAIGRGASNTLMIGEKHIAITYAIGQGPYIDNSVFNGSRQGAGPTPPAAGSWSKCINKDGIGLQKDANFTGAGFERMFGSAHPAGATFALADGSVKHLPFSGDVTYTALLDQMARRALGRGEQPLSPDF
ncbi:MAG: DUF1559 domain-containing protein [Gemmataceae bacterium]